MIDVSVFPEHKEHIRICSEMALLVQDSLNEFDILKLDLKDETDLKSKHSADVAAVNVICTYLNDHNIRTNAFFEDAEPFYGPDPQFSLFIDPIDGSLNRDLGIGDPGVVFAFAPPASVIRFKDIYGGFVYGLHSNHSYASINNCSYFYKFIQAKPLKIRCDASVNRIEKSTLYLNDGYGSHFAKSAFLKAGALSLHAKHRNAIDNSALEICQICRGAAHIRVEARSTLVNGTLKGSDYANILPAFAIGKGANLLITDLKGNSLENEIIDVNKVSDFICCGNRDLLDQVLDIMSNNVSILMNMLNANA